MFDIGFLELMVVGVLGLLVLGPERLPQAARSVGLMVGKIRRTMTGIQNDLERHARTEELKQKLQDPYAQFMDEAELTQKKMEEALNAEIAPPGALQANEPPADSPYASSNNHDAQPPRSS